MDNSKKYFVILFAIAFLSIPCLVSGATAESFTNALYAGQSKMYTIQVPCIATVTLDGEQGGEFSLYAKKGSTTWIPSPMHVTRYPDVSSITPASSQKLNLDAGEWFVVAELKSGFAEYTLVVEKECPMTTSCSGVPCYYAMDCATPAVYRDNVQKGFLNAGESKTFAYRLTGNRSYVEWVLSGPCDDTAPLMQTKTDVDMFRTENCGPDFDLYVYKDCNPKYRPYSAVAADTGLGSNGYVGISWPDDSMLYFVKVYGKRGSGTYDLTARSYTSQDITIAGISPSEYAGIVALETDVKAPDDLNITIPVPPTAYSIKAEEI